MARRLRDLGFAMASLLVCVASAAAAEEAAEAAGPSFAAEFAKGIVQSIVYSALGLVILLVGFKLLDWATPFSLNKEIAEDNNVAAGVVVAGLMIGLGLIVASAIS